MKTQNSSIYFFLEKIHEKFPIEEWNALQKIIVQKKYKKGEYILEIGKVCKKLWFLEKGAVRRYEMYNGEEKTLKFFINDNLLLDYQSVLTNTISETGFKTESECYVTEIPYNKLLELYDQFHFIERLGRKVVEKKYLEEIEYRRQLLNFDALERYNYLVENQPTIFQYFELKSIATFIGITPVSLSRLRKNR